jgi:rhodanese-related sulfurtransferase
MGIDDVLAECRVDLPRLHPAEAWAAAREADTFVVDTRPAFQRRAGEVPGAIVVERNHLEWRLDPWCAARIPEAVHPGIRWIVLCDEGYSSSLAARSLRAVGLPYATDVIGGFQAWATAGLPILHPDRPHRPRGPGEGPLCQVLVDDGGAVHDSHRSGVIAIVQADQEFAWGSLGIVPNQP